MFPFQQWCPLLVVPSVVASVAVVSVTELSVEEVSVDWVGSVELAVVSVLSVESVEEAVGIGEGTLSEAASHIYRASKETTRNLKANLNGIDSDHIIVGDVAVIAEPLRMKLTMPTYCAFLVFPLVTGPHSR